MKNLAKFFHVLFVLSFIQQHVYAQISDYYIIYHPYQTEYPATGRTMGGTTVALADSAPYLLDNPAGINRNEHISFFLSSSILSGKIDFSPASFPDLKDQRWTKNPSFETIAIALPVRLFKHHLTIAGSFNDKLSYDYQMKHDFFSIQLGYHNYLQRISAGVGTLLFQKIKLGFGWSRLLGKREINYYEEGQSFDATKTKLIYDGNLFNLGLQANFSKRLFFGAAVYFPFKLKIKKEDTGSWWSDMDSHTLYEKFKGGFRIGFAYKIFPSLKTGLEYGYQHKFFTNLKYQYQSNGQNYWDDVKVNYTNMQTFAVGVEQKVQFKKTSFPLFLTYRYAEMPYQKNTEFFDINVDSSLPKFGKKAVSQSIAFGANYSWSRFTLFLAAQWEQTGKYKDYPPPIT